MIFSSSLEKDMWLENRPALTAEDAIDVLYNLIVNENSTPENHSLGNNLEEFLGCVLVLKDYFDELE